MSLTSLMWNRRLPRQLKLTNDALFVVGVWFLVISIFALRVEAGFSEDLADEMPKLLISAALVLNRFV